MTEPLRNRVAWRPSYGQLVIVALTVFGLLPWILYATFYDVAFDAHAYFLAQPGRMYAGALGTPDAYLYSPAFSQLIEPLRSLGWETFRTVWRLSEAGALAIMAGPLTGPLLFFHPVSLEFNMGNIHLLMALAIVAGFRWPAIWAFVLLTKVTPGVGLIWFAVRREWMKLGIAVGATAAVVAISAVLDPTDWLSWISVLGGTSTIPEGSFQVITAPLLLRLPAAAALVFWGARTNRRWTVLVASMLALPSVWQHSLSMLVGLLLLMPVPWTRWARRRSLESVADARSLATA